MESQNNKVAMIFEEPALNAINYPVTKLVI